MRQIFIIVILFCSIKNANSQNIGIGTTAPNASAILDVTSNNKGILIPRLTKTEKNAIVSPVKGLLVYQSTPDSVGFHFYDGGKWNWILSSVNVDTLTWRTTGNAGTNANINFVGTKDSRPLVFKISNLRAGIIDTSGTLAFGRGALLNNPGNIKSTAFGDSALFSNGIGATQSYHSTFNTAIGYNALKENTTGFSNTAAGYTALKANTIGQFNAAFGDLALGINTTGNYNTAVGSGSLSNTISGSLNTAIGYKALFNSNNISYNTVIGSNAGYQNTAGSGLTAIGANAGYVNLTGSNNTALGSFATFGAGNLINATAIGATALVNTSNSLVLGSNAKVGIGTSSPLAALHVKRLSGVDSVIVFQGSENSSVFFTDNVTENILLQTGKNYSDLILNPCIGCRIRIGGLAQNNTTEVAGKMFANELGGQISGSFNMVPLGIIELRAWEDDDYGITGTGTASGSYSNLVGNLANGFNATGSSNITQADYLGCYVHLNPSIMTGYSNYFITGILNFDGGAVLPSHGYAVSSELELIPPSGSITYYRIRASYSVDDFPNVGRCRVFATVMVYGIR